MGYLLDAMTPEQVNGQRDVVKNERRQSYENRPYGMASLELDKMLWPADHPYSWPVIGYMEDLDRRHATRTSSSSSRRYYAPNNASLVIAGDIDFDRTQALVEKWFGEVPRGPACRASRAAGRRAHAGQATDAHGSGLAAAPVPRVADAAAVRARRRHARRRVVDSRGRKELAPLQAAGLRHADRAGRLGVPESGALGSSFMIVATARPGHTVAEMQKAIDEELDQLRRRAAGRARGAARASTRSRHLLSPHGACRRIRRQGRPAERLLHAGGGPDFFAEDLARYTSLTAADVQAAVVNWLPRDRRVELDRAAGGEEMTRGHFAAAVVALLASSVAVVASASPARRYAGSFEAAGARAAAAAQRCRRFRNASLSNGLPVWIVESHEVPLVQVNLLSRPAAATTRRASSASPASRPPCSTKAPARGPRCRSPTTSSSSAPTSARAARSTHPPCDSTCPVARLATALPIMADVALRPTFPQAELDRLRQERLTALLQARDDAASSRAAGVRARGLWRARTATAPAPWERESTLKAFTTADLRTFHAVDVSARRTPRSWSLATSEPTPCCRSSRSSSAAGRPRARPARAHGAGRAAAHASVRSRSSTCRARSSRRFASAGSACRGRRPTTSRCRCSTRFSADRSRRG